MSGLRIMFLIGASLFIAITLICVIYQTIEVIKFKKELKNIKRKKIKEEKEKEYVKQRDMLTWLIAFLLLMLFLIFTGINDDFYNSMYGWVKEEKIAFIAIHSVPMLVGFGGIIFTIGIIIYMLFSKILPKNMVELIKEERADEILKKEIYNEESNNNEINKENIEEKESDE